MIDKLALGTVQFGLDYGINNRKGQVEPNEIKEILRLCSKNGINILDTAYAYGSSEAVLGNSYLEKFRIISKLPSCQNSEVFDFFQESLRRLKKERLYGYMLHNFSIYEKDKTIWQQLLSLKSKNIIEKIGISLYSPEELETLWSDGVEVDIIQFPYNLFDRRFEGILPLIRERNIEIHTRSTFLQGLFFKNEDDLPDYFDSIASKIKLLHRLSKENNISTVELCLGFVLQNDFIDKIVIGVDSVEQLLSNINAINNLVLGDFDWSKTEALKEDNIAILNPSFWKI